MRVDLIVTSKRMITEYHTVRNESVQWLVQSVRLKFDKKICLDKQFAIDNMIYRATVNKRIVHMERTSS